MFRRTSHLCITRPLLRNLTGPITGWKPLSRRDLITLAIETSCDDTSVAVLETNDDGAPDEPAAVLHFHEKITANNTSYKGVHPIVSLESHQESLATLIQKAIKHLPDGDDPLFCQDDPEKDAVEWKKRPDFVSVTRGPGMRANLFTGLDTAKGLAVAWQVPLIGVHHMHAHALTPRLVSALAKPDPSAEQEPLSSPSLWDIFSPGPEPSSATQFDPEPAFPFLSLLVSGGHTLLIHSQSLTTHRVLGSTQDSAIGDCLDKVARLIVPAPLVDAWSDTMYGRLLEWFAFPQGRPDYEAYYVPPQTRGQELNRRISPWGWGFSPPLAESPDGLRAFSMDMSFSGLVTAVDRVLGFRWDREAGKLSKVPRTPEEVDEEERRFMAREAMRVAFEHLASRVLLALQAIKMQNPEAPPVETLVVSGGVASNSFLRYVFQEFLKARGYPNIKLIYPPPALCTDNAAMIAWAGMEMYKAGFQNDLNIRALRKWSLEDLLNPPLGN